MSNDKEQNIPNLLKDRIDLRLLTVNVFSRMIEYLKSGKIESVSLGRNTELIIYTTFGTIKGQLLLKENEEVKLNNLAFFHELFMETRDKQLERYLDEEDVNRLVSDTGCLPLVNVEITPFSNPNTTHNLGYFLLYPDQIVGLTFGEHQQY